MPDINKIVYPTPYEATVAKEAAGILSALLSSEGPSGPVISITFKDGPAMVSVPREAFELFKRILSEMAAGNAVNVLPLHAELTTQEAAELLNVSRPYVIKLLNEKRLPFRKVGTHRRIRFDDLKHYKDADDEKRQRALLELTRDAEAMGLDY